MNKFSNILALIIIAGLLAGCGPPLVEKFQEIKTNETAFVIPLEGASKSGQQQFFSESYLKEKKVATKRISIPQRRRETGRAWWAYEWIPTEQVITVNRSPVTREWTTDEKTGTASKNQALYVESADSIGFGVGILLTDCVLEEDTATFLYNYSGKALEEITDKNVRGYIGTILSREFGKYDLETGRRKKNEIINIVKEETIPFFKDYGISITSLGIAEGLVYEDKEIQDVINKKFTAEMKIQIETQNNIAQEKVNIRNVAIAVAEKQAAMEFKQAAEARVAMVELDIKKMKAQAQLNFSERWDGKMPEKMVPEGVMLSFIDSGK